MAPKKNWAPYQENSDLDFSVVSPDLFAEICSEFKEWQSDCESGVLGSLDNFKRRFWPSNLEFGERNIPKGFLDANKIPLLDRYPIARGCAQTMYLLLNSINASGLGMTPKKSFLRVYRDWSGFVRRVQGVFSELVQPT